MTYFLAEYGTQISGYLQRSSCSKYPRHPLTHRPESLILDVCGAASARETIGRQNSLPTASVKSDLTALCSCDSNPPLHEDPAECLKHLKYGRGVLVAVRTVCSLPPQDGQTNPQRSPNLSSGTELSHTNLSPRGSYPNGTPCPLHFEPMGPHFMSWLDTTYMRRIVRAGGCHCGNRVGSLKERPARRRAGLHPRT